MTELALGSLFVAAVGAAAVVAVRQHRRDERAIARVCHSFAALGFAKTGGLAGHDTGKGTLTNGTLVLRRQLPFVVIEWRLGADAPELPALRPTRLALATERLAFRRPPLKHPPLELHRFTGALLGERHEDAEHASGLAAWMSRYCLSCDGRKLQVFLSLHDLTPARASDCVDLLRALEARVHSNARVPGLGSTR